MIILGIDPGSNKIGYGAVVKKNGRLECLTCGLINIKNGNLLILKKSIDKILKKIKPDIVVLEKLFFYKNVKTAIKVAESRGVILFSLIQKKLPFIELTPLELKNSITAYGRSSKLNIKKMVKLILELKEEPKTDDAADALALAIAGINFKIKNK